MNDGEWHTVVIERWKRGGQIQVDGQVPERVQTDQGKTVLNINTLLWIGKSSIFIGTNTFVPRLLSVRNI